MSTELSAVQTYFAKLGLAPEVADIYLALQTHGPLSISELARHSGVERTRIYRLIDQLMESSLIEIEPGSKRGMLKAAPIANLQILITQRELELQSLQDELQLVEQLLGRNSLSTPATHIQTHQGVGTRDRIYQYIQEARSEACGILQMPSPLGESAVDDQQTAEKWITECNKRDLKFRAIISQSETDDNTANTDQATKIWQPKSDGTQQLKQATLRVITASTFPILLSTIVYDDVVIYIDKQHGEDYAVQTRNFKIAGLQRQLFELLWDQAHEMSSRN